MSSLLSPSENDSPAIPNPLPSPQAPKPTRVLACVLCQQRKIKCDRKFPCAHCLKQGLQCVPATQARRRRRFPEKDLLRRLAQYEDLLRANNIRFNPLHQTPSTAGKGNDAGADSDSSDDEQSHSQSAASPTPSSKPLDVFDTKSIWLAICQEGQASTSGGQVEGADSLERTVKDALEMERGSDYDLFLFGSPQASVDLSTFHPQPVEIFRLWQIYLDNVNPLLKVIHVPTMQGRIIEAVGNVHGISPPMESLMFSIYCIAITSLSNDECQSMLGMSQTDLLTKYQFGCQQALMNARFLVSRERDTLISLYLFLLSLRPEMHPRSLSAMFSIAIRIAKVLKLHREPPLERCSVFESEMQRRLWWSLVLDDTRRCEVADVSDDASLSPAWSRKTPSNVNDSDLRPDMKEIIAGGAKVSESIFVVVRSELADFLRHTSAFLDFHHPRLKPIAKELPDGGSLLSLRKRIENDYLQYCDPENPIHYLTIWTTHAFIAKQRMIQYYATLAHSGLPATETEMDDAMVLAFEMLDCDTKLLSTPKTKPFIWFIRSHFPFPGYMHIIYDLRRRPFSRHADRAWEVMANNYDFRIHTMSRMKGPITKVFGKFILRSWDARVAEWKSDQPLKTPRIVQQIWEMEAKDNPPTDNMAWGNLGNTPEVKLEDSFSTMQPLTFTSSDLYDLAGSGGMNGLIPGDYTNFSSQGAFDFMTDQYNWPSGT
ncbi:unnamed protein product [Clonostachys rhizophaga]|uniref:Zn(2)-C6 fungal-type domain-containing protein n=1 Tax=Clonostachys rhizophaga TaxID=160324 RepID=A0A9N9YS30_9HYPO|nr:unnamed protein product [Clonostachys rhizophaga]